ncbi:hypothetical protein PGTUg99_022951 [Puccinia graminis f. sp. tritici]|uniref:Uncharacterized protein n=1 Tax=Puccinia graminis f. sp. tritici TaxID=56615 RepID=A0A5B0Q9D4_PUCGR|nr:hypothetical protein PGTUg99_022951 [Puccinia graminis f. sp. tritici]
MNAFLSFCEMYFAFFDMIEMKKLSELNWKPSVSSTPRHQLPVNLSHFPFQESSLPIDFIRVEEPEEPVQSQRRVGNFCEGGKEIPAEQLLHEIDTA